MLSTGVRKRGERKDLLAHDVPAVSYFSAPSRQRQFATRLRAICFAPNALL